MTYLPACADTIAAAGTEAEVAWAVKAAWCPLMLVQYEVHFVSAGNSSFAMASIVEVYAVDLARSSRSYYLADEAKNFEGAGRLENAHARGRISLWDPVMPALAGVASDEYHPSYPLPPSPYQTLFPLHSSHPLHALLFRG